MSRDAFNLEGAIAASAIVGLGMTTVFNGLRSGPAFAAASTTFSTHGRLSAR